MKRSEQVNPNTNYISRFNLSKEMLPNVDPEYNVPYGTSTPLITARGNFTFQQLIDAIGVLWCKYNREVLFVPFGGGQKYLPDFGYIVYSLESKKPAQGHLKPQFMEDVVNTDDGDFQGTIFIQKFDFLIEFSAVHGDPRVAEQIMESFEDFMMIIGPELKYGGAQDMFFVRRTSDSDQTRFGDDLSYKTTMYLAILQKIIIVRPQLLESVRIDVRTFTNNLGPETNEVLFAEMVREHPLTTEEGEAIIDEYGKPITT